MKRTFKRGLVIIVFGLLIKPVHAVDFGKVGMFGAGFLSGVVFHEIGHSVAVIAQGGRVADFQFQSISAEFDDTSQESLNQKLRVTALAGYTAQSLATEVIVNNRDWHKNDFALGWMSLGILVNLSNPIRYYAFGQKGNDLGLYEKHGGNPAIPAALMVTHAGWTLYRMFNQTDIPFYVTKDMLGLTFKF